MWIALREKRRGYVLLVCEVWIGLGEVDADVMKAAGGGSR